MTLPAAKGRPSTAPRTSGLPPEGKDDFGGLLSLLGAYRRRIVVAFLTVTGQRLLLLAVLCTNLRKGI